MSQSPDEQLDYTEGGTREAVTPMTDMPRTPQGDATIGDPAFDLPIEEGHVSANEDTQKAEETAETTAKSAEDIEEEEKRRKEELEKAGDGLTESERKGGKDGKGGVTDTAGKDPLSDLATKSPSSQVASQPSMPSMPSSGGMPSGGMPSLPQMTQSDLAGAPNRDQLIKDLKALRDSGGEGSTALAGMSDDPDEAEVQEYLKKLEAQGIDYVWGGGHSGPPGASQGIRDGGVADSFGDYKNSGLDCSGLTRLVTYDLHGVDINGTAATQYNMGRPVSASEARAGDIFFPDSAGRPPQHVQVYAGGNQVFEAQKSGTKLKFSPLTSGEFRRYAD